MLSDPRVSDALVAAAIAFLGLLSAIITVMTPKVIAYLSAKEHAADASGQADTAKLVRLAADTAVRWAEQQLAGANGQAKKELAISWLDGAARDAGITLAPGQAAALVEEAVRVLQATGMSFEATEAKRPRDVRGRYVKKEMPDGTQAGRAGQAAQVTAVPRENDRATAESRRRGTATIETIVNPAAGQAGRSAADGD